MKAGYDILGLGGIAVDDLIYVEAYPAPDTKTLIQGRERRCGGLTATAMVAASRAGKSCAFAGVLGPGELSAYVQGELQQEGVDVEYVVQHPEGRPIHATIVVDGRGQRNIFAEIPAVTGADKVRLREELILSCSLLFVDDLGGEGAVRAARLARSAGIPVVADFERQRSPLFAELLALPDHLVLPQNLAATLTGAGKPADALRDLWGDERRAVVITCGSQGCWYRGGSSAGDIRHQPAFPVNAVDTTGCGDVFHGAYAAALLDGLDLDGCVRRAAATAALKATRTGGWAGIPHLREVQDFLQCLGEADGTRAVR